MPADAAPTVATLRAHVLELAAELDVDVRESTLPSEAQPTPLGGRRPCARVPPLIDVLGYVVALHELGHYATGTPQTVIEPPGAGPEATGRRLLREGRAWAWAHTVALIGPNEWPQREVLEAWTTYITAAGGDVPTGGAALVAPPHRREYEQLWARASSGWTWEPALRD